MCVFVLCDTCIHNKCLLNHFELNNPFNRKLYLSNGLTFPPSHCLKFGWFSPFGFQYYLPNRLFPPSLTFLWKPPSEMFVDSVDLSLFWGPQWGPLACCDWQAWVGSCVSTRPHLTGPLIWEAFISETFCRPPDFFHSSHLICIFHIHGSYSPTEGKGGTQEGETPIMARETCNTVVWSWTHTVAAINLKNKK